MNTADETKKRGPDLDREALFSVEATLLDEVAAALSEQHTLDGQGVAMVGRASKNAAWLRARLGPSSKTYELELFSRDISGEGLDGAPGVLIDYLDGFLTQWQQNGREGWAPLDWEGRPYDLDDSQACIVFVRGEVRDLEAEEAREAFLQKIN